MATDNPTKLCERCGQPRHGKAKRFCSYACERADRVNRQPAPSVCQFCGATYKAASARAKYCSHACGYAAQTKPPAERFWAKVEKTEGCWLWRAATKDEYGRFGETQGRILQAHRYAWELAHGPIPKGLCVCHNCPNGDNPRCVRPSHMFLGTIAHNNRDMAQKGRASGGGGASKGKPRPGRIARGEQSGTAKLTDSAVRMIRSERAAGTTLAELARRFKVGISAIGAVSRRQTWRHVS